MSADVSTIKPFVAALAIGGAAIFGLTNRSQTPAPADLVLRGGRIITLDDRLPDAQALAVSAGRIVGVGTNLDIAKYVGPSTEVIELGGQVAIPGFIEGHGHFTGVGENRVNLDLRSGKSWDEIVQQVAQAVEKARPGQWIVGRGWHQDKWLSRPHPNVGGFPVHESLDTVSPNNPVVLTHASGHASFVNQRAMALSNLTRDTRNPTGGEILKDTNGNPTGLLRETAQGLVRRPDLTEEEVRNVLTLADEEVVGKGITTFQDAGSSFATINLVRKLVEERKLRVRLWMMVRAGNQSLQQNVDRYRLVGYGNNQLTVRAIKVTA